MRNGKKEEKKQEWKKRFESFEEELRITDFVHLDLLECLDQNG